MKKINLEKILLIFIAILPILDLLSFLFRNLFGSSISPTLIIRPLISITTLIIIFFKNKIKLKIIAVGFIYGIYALIHLFIFYKIKTDISCGTLFHELQYLINYTFLILNLFLYLFVFYKKDSNKLKKYILIALFIYISSIYISIITNTYSTTYIEGIGIKGWFESGNSISSIFILGLFILFAMIKDKKLNKIVIPTILLIGFYLIKLIGTRTGLLGFISVLGIYVLSLIIIYFKNINFKKNIYSILFKSFFIICTISIIILLFIFVPKTLERRKYINNLNSGIMDPNTNEPVHVTLDILEIKQKIENNELFTEYISIPAQNAIIDLYNFANKYEVTSTDRRTQQLVYNYYLVLNQHNFITILFGNGLLSNFAELTLEMEIPALLFNFGILGFILYFIPFLLIFIYGVYIGIKNIKKIDEEFLILLAGSFFTFVLAFFTGVVFFHSSCMIIVVVLNVLLLNKTSLLKTK